MKKITAMTLATILAATLSVPVGALQAHAATSTAQVQASVSFRTQPSTSSSVIRLLKTGESVTVVSEYNSYWLQVRDSSGKVGYISSQSKYLNYSPTSSGTGGQAVTAPSTTSNAVIKASVSFRTSPSTSASRIRYLSAGEQVTVLSQPNSAWYQVKDANGVTGYISTSTQYITTNYTPSTPSTGAGTGTSTPANTSAAIEAVIAAGMKYWGTPYEYSSDRNTTTTFDCSDFVRTAFREGMGLILPSDSRSQGTYVKNKGPVQTDWTKLKRGDLMLFMDYKGSQASSYAGVNKSTATITHVGIYLGDGKILHTYSTASGGVKTTDIAGTAWEYRFLYGGSVL